MYSNIGKPENSIMQWLNCSCYIKDPTSCRHLISHIHHNQITNTSSSITTTEEVQTRQSCTLQGETNHMELYQDIQCTNPLCWFHMDTMGAHNKQMSLIISLSFWKTWQVLSMFIIRMIYCADVGYTSWIHTP